MQLHRAHHDVVQHLGHRHLHRGDIAAHLLVVVVLVDLPRGAQHQQPELLDLDPAVGDLLLRHLEVAERALPGLPGHRPLAHHVECLARHGDRAHGVVYPPAAEAGLGDRECLALAAEDMIGRYPHVVVAHVTVRGVRRGLPAHPDVADDLHARCVGGNDEQRHLLVRAGLRIGDRHDDVERREPGVRGEPLLAVDHPVVTVALGAGGEQPGIRAALRFGHRVTRRDLPVQQRLQITPLLLLGAEHRDDLRVAGIRRLRAEHRRRPPRTADDLVEQSELHLAETLPAEIRAQMRRPQSLILDLLLQRPQHPHQFRVLLVVRIQRCQIERFEFVAHELLHPVELALILRVGLEVPHVPQPLMFRGRRPPGR